MVTELKITIIDDEKKKLIKEFLIYDPFMLNQDDPIVNRALKESIQEFAGDPSTIKITTNTMVE